MSVRERTAASHVRLRVRVTPGARRSEIVGRHGDAWKLRVQAPPERGKANREVVAVLAGALGVPPSAVRIVHGHASGDKFVEVDRLSIEDAERLLGSAGEARA